jgi:septal ring factor EnvC (AmiA/AmiB activator)
MLKGWIGHPFYTADAAPGSAPAESPAPAPAPPPEHMIPKSRFDEINEQLKQLKAEKEQREAQERQAQEDAAKQRGEWERLASEREQELHKLKPQAEQAKTLAKLLNAHIDGQIAAWPDELKALDPGPSDLERRQAWAQAAAGIAAKLAQQPPAPHTDAGAGNRPQPAGGAGADPNRTPYRFQRAGDVTW